MGGDIIKFSGDALTVIFRTRDSAIRSTGRPPCGSLHCSHSPLSLAVLRACSCCLEIHKRLHNYDTGIAGVRLSLHIGIGAGPIKILQVGGSVTEGQAQ